MLETIAAAYSGFIGSISNYLYTYILIVLLVAGGIYFTVRTKFVQFRFLPESIRIVMQPSEDQNSISAFKTLMVSTASRVGTGNIAGISTAICLGGTGRGLLDVADGPAGQRHRLRGEALWHRSIRRQCPGRHLLRRPRLLHPGRRSSSAGWAAVFAVVLILTYMVGFNLVASFNIADSLKAYSFFSDPTLTPLDHGHRAGRGVPACASAAAAQQIANITADAGACDGRCCTWPSPSLWSLPTSPSSPPCLPASSTTPLTSRPSSAALWVPL